MNIQLIKLKMTRLQFQLLSNLKVVLFGRTGAGSAFE